MNNLCGQEFLTGPFDECIACESLCAGCSGPRTTAMVYPRWVVFMKALMKRFGITNQKIADDTPLSKSTVDDIFALRRKDISRETCCIIENYILGDGKWPCAKKMSENMDVVYEDRPETLEALRLHMESNQHKEKQLEILQQNFKEAQIRHQEDLARLRADYEADVQEYKELVAHMRVQVNRKDDYIDRLAKKAGI